MVCKNTKDSMRKANIFGKSSSMSSCNKPNDKMQGAIRESRDLMAAHRGRFPNSCIASKS